MHTSTISEVFSTSILLHSHSFNIFSPALLNSFEMILKTNIARRKAAGKMLLSCPDQTIIGTYSTAVQCSVVQYHWIEYYHSLQCDVM